MNTTLIRIKRELKKCLELYEIELEKDDLLKWIVNFEPNTDVFNKKYKLLISIPNSYPQSPPTLVFLDKVYHPNVDNDGKMCIGLLTDWKNSYTIKTVLNVIKNLFEEPNLDDPVNLSVSSVWGDKEKYKKLFSN